MRHTTPLIAVSVGGTSLGKRRSERQIGTLRPVLDAAGEPSGTYHVLSTSGYVEAEVWSEGVHTWRVRTGDPTDMDSPKATLPEIFPERIAAVTAAVRSQLLALGERMTYVRYGECERTPAGRR